MCAWWANQPAYGSNPTSKFVRENFAWLKPYADIIANSGITQAQMNALQTLAPTIIAGAAANLYLKGAGAGVLPGYSALRLADVGVDIVAPGAFAANGNQTVGRLTFQPSVAILVFATVDASHYAISIGFDNGTVRRSLNYGGEPGVTQIVNTMSVSGYMQAYISSWNATQLVLTWSNWGLGDNSNGIILTLP